VSTAQHILINAFDHPECSSQFYRPNTSSSTALLKRFLTKLTHLGQKICHLVTATAMNNPSITLQLTFLHEMVLHINVLHPRAPNCSYSKRQRSGVITVDLQPSDSLPSDILDDLLDFQCFPGRLSCCHVLCLRGGSHHVRLQTTAPDAMAPHP
jgi:hypothetical protein